MTRSARRHLARDVQHAALRSGKTIYDQPWRSVIKRLQTRDWRKAAVQAHVLIAAAPPLKIVPTAVAAINAIVVSRIVPAVVEQFFQASPLFRLTRSKKGGMF